MEADKRVEKPTAAFNWLPNGALATRTEPRRGLRGERTRNHNSLGSMGSKGTNAAGFAVVCG